MRLEGLTIAVEFRHKSWFDEKHSEQTLAFERARQLVNVVVDEPQSFANCIPAVWTVTNPGLTIVRLHGRNHASWNLPTKVLSDRFNYDYSDEELAELAASVEKLAASVTATHVILNNNFEDQGVRNGRTLQEILL